LLHIKVTKESNLVGLKLTSTDEVWLDYCFGF